MGLPLQSAIPVPPKTDPAHIDPAFTVRASTPRQFRLLRYFAFTSLFGVLLVLAPLLYFYRDLATEALERHQTRDNVAITQVFASTLWPRHAAYVQSAHSLTSEALRGNPRVATIREDVLQQMRGLSVVKVKIYDLHGMTVFSTDEKQIGEDKSDDDGVQAAIAGRVVSEIAFENQFDSFERVINDRNLISSYIPIRANDSLPPEGVFEVYSDVTDYVAELNRASWELVGVVLGSLSLLYLFLFAIVRRADIALRAQAQEVRRDHEALITYQANHDPLTDLPNREHFFRQFASMLLAAELRHQKCVLLCVSLDGFKNIYDSLGHRFGDATIIQVSNRLRGEFDNHQVTARIGDDEFAIAIQGPHGETTPERIIPTIERLQKAIAGHPIVAFGQELSVTTSVGVAIYPDNGFGVAELTQSADLALSHAQKEGRNRFRFHASSMNDIALDTMLLERDLRKALDDEQFVLHYQPKVDLANGRVVGAEALIRWQHPTRGLVNPMSFIPLAEERGLIIPIGEWVIEEACRQRRAWNQLGMVSLPIAVNLSAEHFQAPNLLQQVSDSLSLNGVPPCDLELELTESSILQDAPATIAAMQQLKELGIVLALDDFGTGYSSLSQLKGLPLDNLKLDQSFVSGLPDDADDLAICTAVVAMGQALGLKVIAEGIETPLQLDVLSRLGCHVGQGYLFSRPLPADAFLAFMQNRATPAFNEVNAASLPVLGMT